MSHSSHNAGAPEVSADMIAERKAGWHGFMRFIVINCLVTAGILVFLLLVFRVF